MKILAYVFFSIDLETFLGDGLKGETLSKKAKEKREGFLKRLKEVKLGYVYFMFPYLKHLYGLQKYT